MRPLWALCSRKPPPPLSLFRSPRRDPARSSTSPPGWSCGTERRGRRSRSGRGRAMSPGGGWSSIILLLIEFNDYHSQIVFRHLFSRTFRAFFDVLVERLLQRGGIGAAGVGQNLRQLGGGAGLVVLPVFNDPVCEHRHTVALA